jgi:uncharacterized membrane protein
MTAQPPHASFLPDDGHLPEEARRLIRAARPKAWIPFIITAALGVALLVWVLLALPDLPEQVPTHWGPDGTPEEWSATSFGTVAMGPLIGLGTAAMMAGVAALLPAMTPGLPPDGRSDWARVRGHGVHFGMISALGWICLLVMLMTALPTAEILLGALDGLPWWALPLTMTVLMPGIFAALSGSMRRWHRWAEDTSTAFGFHASAEERAEEERWTATGLMNDPDEPSIMVSRREGYGVGATVNIGSPGGRLLYRGFLLLFAVGLPLLFWLLTWPR